MTTGMHAASEFSRASQLHLETVAVCTAILVALCLAGRRAARHSPAAERRLRRAWAVLLAGGHAVSLVSICTSRFFDPSWALPLHLCHAAVIPVGLGLWFESPRARTLAYFWALGLSSQAFFTPILTEGPDSLFFWTFWGDHTTLCGGAAYIVFVCGYRPRPEDARFAFLATLGYAALVLPLDLYMDWNYGFVGRHELPGTLLEWFPPWPWRLLVLGGVVALWFALLTGVWGFVERIRSTLRVASTRQ